MNFRRAEAFGESFSEVVIIIIPWFVLGLSQAATFYLGKLILSPENPPLLLSLKATIQFRAKTTADRSEIRIIVLGQR